MKKSVLVLFGGCSSEHDVSLKSATTILNNIDKTKYEVHPVGITKEGKWLLYTGKEYDLTKNDWQKNGVPAFRLSSFSRHSLKIRYSVYS